MNGFSMDDFYFIAVGLTFIFAIVLLICISAIVKRLDKVADALKQIADAKCARMKTQEDNERRRRESIKKALDGIFQDECGANIDTNENDDVYIRVEQGDDVYTSKTVIEPVDNIIPFKGKDGK
jgi:polyribonucleotide nucleotidyltransferase